MKISHSQSSRLYRAERIPSHTCQTRATFMVLIHFNKTYKHENVKRHATRIQEAMLHIEESEHE